MHRQCCAHTDARASLHTVQAMPTDVQLAQCVANRHHSMGLLQKDDPHTCTAPVARNLPCKYNFEPAFFPSDTTLANILLMTMREKAAAKAREQSNVSGASSRPEGTEDEGAEAADSSGSAGVVSSDTTAGFQGPGSAVTGLEEDEAKLCLLGEHSRAFHVRFLTD